MATFTLTNGSLSGAVFFASLLAVFSPVPLPDFPFSLSSASPEIVSAREKMQARWQTRIVLIRCDQLAGGCQSSNTFRCSPRAAHYETNPNNLPGENSSK